MPIGWLCRAYLTGITVNGLFAAQNDVEFT